MLRRRVDSGMSSTAVSTRSGVLARGMCLSASFRNGKTLIVVVVRNSTLCCELVRGDSPAECGELERLLRRDRNLSRDDKEKTSHFSELSMLRERNEVVN